MEIENKIAIVTGGAGGLGYGIANALKEKGSTVIIFDLNKDKLDELSEDYIKYNVDITDYEETQKSVNDVFARFEKIDILVNNAGNIYNEPLINIMNPQMKHNYETFKKTLEINLNSVFIMTSVIAEKMVLKRNKGVIVNISSISAYGNAGQTAYSAAKAGVIAMTKTWSKELGSFGIRSVAVAPGFIDTESTNHALNESIIKHIKSNTPLKRLGKVGEVAQSVIFAVENDFLNGAVIDINGGISI